MKVETEENGKNYLRILYMYHVCYVVKVSTANQTTKGEIVLVEDTKNIEVINWTRSLYKVYGISR